MNGGFLSESDAFNIATLITCNTFEPLQLSALLTALAIRGETAEVTSGFARALRDAAIRVELDGVITEIVGTGGDGFATQNISTAASILASACGARVAKHGSVSVSSLSGAADVLASLGVARLGAPLIKECVERAGIAFFFAPLFHPALKSAAPVRAALKMRTLFNLVGPLLNPAGAKHVLLGVWSKALLPVMAEALRALGATRALVVHTPVASAADTATDAPSASAINNNTATTAAAAAGLDELATLGPALCIELTSDGKLIERIIDSQEWGVPRCTIKDLEGGTPDENAAGLRALFSGGMTAAQSHLGRTVALNAGAALYVSGKVETVREGYELALIALEQGKGIETLDLWVTTSQELANTAAAAAAATK